MNQLNNRQERLFEFVKSWHSNQKRKYTGEPYWYHLRAVAGLVAEYETKNGEVEIALCHDLLEDTLCTAEMLGDHLAASGYLGGEGGEIHHIMTGVISLTNVYTTENYPNWNRKKRKEAELDRLSDIVSYAQTVKYADMIDNTESIVKLDPNFAKVYVLEQSMKIRMLRKGHEALLLRCTLSIEKALDELKSDYRT
jgi:(p)ppGpp synthase/HD superfamily hydrolase